MRLTHGLGSPGTSLPCGQRPAASPELVLPAPGPAPHARRPRGLPSGQRGPPGWVPPHSAPQGPATWTCLPSAPRGHHRHCARVQVHVAEGESRPCHPPLGGVQAAPCAGRLAAVPRLSPAAGPRAEGVPCEARARALHGHVTVPVLLSRVLFSAEPPPVRAEASGRACRRDCSVPSPGTAQLRCRPGHPAPSWVFREAREGGRVSISQGSRRSVSCAEGTRSCFREEEDGAFLGGRQFKPPAPAEP